VVADYPLYVNFVSEAQRKKRKRAREESVEALSDDDDNTDDDLDGEIVTAEAAEMVTHCNPPPPPAAEMVTHCNPHGGWRAVLWGRFPACGSRKRRESTKTTRSGR